MEEVTNVTTLTATDIDKFRLHHIMSQTAEHKDDMKSSLPTTSSNLPLRSSFSSSPILSLKENDKMQPASTLVDDPRALQLALELSMVGLSSCDALNNSVTQTQNFSTRSKTLYHTNFIHQQDLQQSHSLQQFNSHQQFDSNALSAISAAVAAAAATQSSLNKSVDFPTTISSTASISTATGIEERSKKSQNMTECVPVPSSEHVAEIVGRQGCKIKALRAKTNTYIKTPVRNEEPVFVVTGRKEDVAKAKREIVSAAEHFSFIRATRKNSLLHNNSVNNMTVIGENSDINSIADGCIGHGRISLGPPVIPGQVTIQVRVPYRVVGLVVGPKGATIKHIQQETQTYIVTPSREKEPIFEVTGLPDNVQSARKHIEAHIALRTGSLQAIESHSIDVEMSGELASANLTAVHSLNTLSQILNEDSNKEFLDSFYKNRLCSDLDYIEGSTSNRIFLKEQNEIDVKIPEKACGQLLATPLTITDCNPYPKVGSNDVSNAISNADNCIVNNTEISHQREFTTAKLMHKKQGDILNDLHVSGNGTINTNSTMPANAATRSCSSASSTASSKSANNSSVSTNTNSSRPDLLNFWKNLANSLDVNEDTGEPPSIWNTQTQKLTYSTQEIPRKKSTLHSTTISPTDSLIDENSSTVISNFNSNTNLREVFTHTTMNSQQQKAVENASLYLLKCVLCNKKEVANRVACGHNMLCKDCGSTNASAQISCPICNNRTYHNMYALP